MVTELVEPIPLSDEQPPKRRRGRPPKLNPDGSRITPPKLARPTRGKPRRAASPAKPRTGKLKEEIAAFLTLVNSVVVVSPLGTRPVEAIGDPSVTPTRIGDELDSFEIAALAAAISRQCDRSPTFRKYVERALSVGSGGTLLTTIGIIAARRAARHGVLPSHIDPMLGIMLASGGVEALADMPTPAAPTPPPATGEIVPDRSPTNGAIDYENIGTFAEP